MKVERFANFMDPVEFRQQIRSIVSQQFSHWAHPEAEFKHQNGSKHIRRVCVTNLLKGKHKVV